MVLCSNPHRLLDTNEGYCAMCIESRRLVFRVNYGPYKLDGHDRNESDGGGGLGLSGP